MKRLAVLIAASFAGCTSACAPVELRIQSLTRTDIHDQPEIPSPSASPFSRFLTDEEMVRTGIANPYEDRPHRPLLKVEFTTPVNLEALVEDGYSLMVKGYFCERPSDDVPLSLVTLYRDGQSLGRRGAQKTKPALSSTTGYYTFLNIAHKAIVPSNPPDASFDLSAEPEDVCLQLYASMLPLTTLESEIAVIPKADIARSLSSQSK